jgi:hypothetical protein
VQNNLANIYAWTNEFDLAFSNVSDRSWKTAIDRADRLLQYQPHVRAFGKVELSDPPIGAPMPILAATRYR